MNPATTRIEIEGAIERINLRRHIAEQLRALPAADRRTILLELLAETGDEAPHNNGVSHKAKARARRQVAMVLDNGTSNRQAVLQALVDSPGISLSEIAERVYRTNTPVTVARIRAILTVLKKKGLVRNPKQGKWVAKKSKEVED